MEDLQNASKLLVKALEIRERYMKMSRQGFPNTCSKFLREQSGKSLGDDEDDVQHRDKATLEGNNSPYFYE